MSNAPVLTIVQLAAEARADWKSSQASRVPGSRFGWHRAYYNVAASFHPHIAGQFEAFYAAATKEAK